MEVKARINGQEVRIDPVTGEATKRCSNPGCDKRGEWLPLDSFARSKVSTSGRHGWCRACVGRSLHANGSVERNLKRIRERCKIVDAQISTLFSDVCDVCDKEFERWILEFHHIDPQSKQYSLGTLRARIASAHPGTDKERELWKLFMNEANKCLQVCPICHKGIHHYAEEDEEIPEKMKVAISMLKASGGVKMGRKPKYKPE